MQTIWGVDLGGTKIEGIVLQADNNKILARLRVPTEGSQGFEHVVGQVKKLIDLLKTETKFEPKVIGFSTPGTIDPSTQTMKNSNIVALNGKPFKKAIEEVLEIPTEMANDANCFALAEANFGSVQDIMPEAKVVFGAILGTGVGGGVVINGQVLNGRHGIGGEWGHNQFDENGPACYCGKNGCNEQVFAGPALQKYYEARTGTFKPMQEIYQLHQSGTDQDATATIRFLIESFGKAVHQIINVLDPDCIVLGGGLSHIEELYTESQAEIAKYIFNSRKVETLILKPKLGDSAGVFGAIELVRGL
jgi:fructokinase